MGARGYLLLDILSHSWPEKYLSQSVQHFVPARVAIYQGCVVGQEHNLPKAFVYDDQ
jgi:hypothetical protein